MILKTSDHSTGSHNEVNFLIYTVGDERNMTVTGEKLCIERMRFIL